MKIYLNENVYDAAKHRIHRLFDEFDVVVVSFSGGKDSTVILNLALEVATERNRLPLKVMFIDQEAEWQTVIDYIRTVMHDPRVEPYWLQVPIQIFNATSGADPWLYCWRDGAEWIRPKEPDSLKANIYGTTRFADLFPRFAAVHFPRQSVAQIGGVRAEESPGRLQGLTAHPTYKDITWGNAHGKRGSGYEHYTFYPLYDWSYTDVWKAIHDHGWPYCALYDSMYQYGIPVMQMRVSNVHHETAVDSLRFLQEIEPQTWDRIVARVQGVNAVKQVRDAYRPPTELPRMFASWQEYRDYLVEHLPPDDETKAIFRKQFAAYDARYMPEIHNELAKAQIAALLVNDYHGTKLDTWRPAHQRYLIQKGTRSDVYSRRA